MHPEAEALLNAIYDHPDDDTPRLVYADWLQEHGQENYAQFIRLQCAAAREQLWSAEANRLWEEIGRVWNRLYYEWLPATQWEVESSRFNTLDAIDFERGFLRSTINVTSELVVTAPNCWAWLPTPGTDLEIGRADAALISLAHNPLLRRLRWVRNGPRNPADWYEANPRNTPEALNVFLSSPFLSNLNRLELQHQVLADSTLDVLQTAEHLASIRSLSVSIPTPGTSTTKVAQRKYKNDVQNLRKRFSKVEIYG